MCELAYRGDNEGTENGDKCGGNEVGMGRSNVGWGEDVEKCLGAG